MRSTTHFVIRNGKLIPKNEKQEQKNEIENQRVVWKAFHQDRQHFCAQVVQYKARIKQLQLQVDEKNKELNEKNAIIERLQKSMSFNLSQSSNSHLSSLLQKQNKERQCLKQIKNIGNFEKKKDNNSSISLTSNILEMNGLRRRIGNSEQIVKSMDKIVKGEKGLYIPLQIKKFIEDVLNSHETLRLLLERLVEQHNEQIEEIRSEYMKQAQEYISRTRRSMRWNDSSMEKQRFSVETSLWQKQDDDLVIFE